MILQLHHEKLWPDEVVELHYHLLVMNGISSFQATYPTTVPKFHGIVISRLLRDCELDEMQTRETGHVHPVSLLELSTKWTTLRLFSSLLVTHCLVKHCLLYIVKYQFPYPVPAH